jgi:hypothetical protein
VIERQPISGSSNIKSIGFDPKERIMAVEFSDGAVYHYHDVEKNIYEDLLGAKSVGSHFHKNIKGNYKTLKQ